MNLEENARSLAQKIKAAGFSYAQLTRLYRKCYARMDAGYGNSFLNYGWDWTTLRLVKPEWWAALRAVLVVMSSHEANPNPGLPRERLICPSEVAGKFN